MNARMRVILNGWGAIFALSFGLLTPSSATAEPIRFSTSGLFDLATGTVKLAGVSDAAPEGQNFAIGAVPVAGVEGPLGNVPFRLQFRFNNDLPPIDVSGTVGSLGYNPELPVLDPAVSTTATLEQLALYPAAFRDLIAHPDWFHTTSFRDDSTPMMDLFGSAGPYDPAQIRPVPEPSSILIFAITLAGLGRQVRRRRG
jgi:hypothetical protein